MIEANSREISQYPPKASIRLLNVNSLNKIHLFWFSRENSYTIQSNTIQNNTIQHKTIQLGHNTIDGKV